jgi:hypothetical protein
MPQVFDWPADTTAITGLQPSKPGRKPKKLSQITQPRLAGALRRIGVQAKLIVSSGR